MVQDARESVQGKGPRLLSCQRQNKILVVSNKIKGFISVSVLILDRDSDFLQFLLMQDYPMSLFSLSTWSIFWAGLVKGTND